jgi:hypothetical protein
MNEPVTKLDQRFSDPDAMAAAGMKAGSSRRPNCPGSARSGPMAGEVPPHRFETCRTASDLGFHKISYAAR